MNKNELEAKKAGIEAEKFGALLAMISNAFKWAAFAFLGYLFFDTLKALGTNSPESLEALGRLIEKMKLSDIVHYIVTGMLGAGWALERKGKKRAIKKLAKDRKSIEQGDPYNASSQLNENGDTPSKY